MIQIRNLYKTYHLKTGDVKALDDVSLDIAAGDIYGVIGYSGAGKSTLVRCLNLLEVPDAGSVTVDGKELCHTENGRLLRLSDKELSRVRRGIGMIFQHFNLLDRSTVFDNVAYPLKYTGLSKEEIRRRVSEMLTLVDLSDKAEAYPSQLSGGQKQRVAIARALAGRPKVLLSDEATSALDPDATDSILDLLARLNRQLGLTIVLITHEMSVIKAICNKVAVLEDGRVVEEGDAYEVFANPQAPITRKFISSASALGKLETLVKRGQVTADGGRLIILTFSKDSVGDALISAISRNYGLSVNIALANIDMLHDGALGRLACVVKGEPENIEAALQYLRDNKVGVEEIKYA